MTKKKKILIVGPELSLRGGVAHHIKTLLSSSLNKTYQLHYFKVGPDKDDCQLLVILKFLLAPLRFIQKLWTLWPDVIHFNPSFDPKSLHRELNLMLISQLHHRPNLVQFHGGNLSRLIQNGSIPVYVKLTLKLAAQFVVLTHIQKIPLLKYCPEHKINIIPNMVNTMFYCRKKENNNSRFRILYMSKIEQKKGVFDVVEAIPCVVKKFPDVKFFFAGDGPDQEKIKLICHENQYDDWVYFLGYIQQQRKIDFLSRGDLFLFPSHYDEGMPYSLLEAMAAGLPVIATRTGGISELIEDQVNGYLIPPGQPEILAQAIIKLLSSQQQRKDFGSINRYKAETEFDIKIVCEKFKMLYEKLSQ